MTRAPRSSNALIVGIAARMRVSSVTLPPSSGTLKSTRTSARLPRSSSSRRSVIVFLFIRGLQADADVAQQIDAARGVAPLVVVPARDLEQRAVDDVRNLG